MACVDTLQQNNLFEDKISAENMMSQQHPEQARGGDEGLDALLSDVTRGSSSEDRVKDVDEESVDDLDQPLSSRRSRMIVLSDEEEEEESDPPGIASSSSSQPLGNEASIGSRNVMTIGSDSESDDIFSMKPDTLKPKAVYNPAIFDTEDLSDEDLPPRIEEEPSHSPPRKDNGKAVSSKGKKKEKKPRQPDVKAQEELREIHRESQRLVRESRVALPYHRPKQRTLAEFLARRKQTMPEPSKLQNQSLTMTMRNMEVLRSLEEKKKQVDEFYKSDSDTEDPDDDDWMPDKKAASPQPKEETNSCTAVESVSDFDLPDLTAPLAESPKPEECEETIPESLLQTNQTVVSSEDEGLGTSEKSMNSPSDPSQSGATEGTQLAEEVLSVIEHTNGGDKSLEKVSTETDVAAEGLGKREETVSEESANVGSEDCHASDLTSSSNNTGTTNLTPKLRLLTSRLQEKELKQIMSVTPKLNSGRKDDVIDLDECSAPSQNSGLSEFVCRFLRHADNKPKPAEKQQVNLNIVSKIEDSNGGEHLELSSLTVTVDAKEDQLAGEAVPGSRLTAFKTALQTKIRQQRELHRQKRVQEKQFMETEELPEDYHDDDRPNEEMELTDQSDTETESEPEENDVLITDKKRKKNTFVDDEAEEEDDLEPEISDSEEATRPVNDSDDESDASEATKERKRVIKKPDNDSEEEEIADLTLNWNETQDLEPQHVPLALPRSSTDDTSLSLTSRKGEALDKDLSTASFDSSFELYGSVIAGHQPGGGMKLSAENGLSQPLTKNKSNSFYSSTSSTSKKQQEAFSAAEDFTDIFDNEATSASPAAIDLNFSSLDCTQPHDSNKENQPFAGLRLDFSKIDDTQDKDDLIGLCSGKFSDQPTASSEKRELCEDHVSPSQEMSELLGLCSGRFIGHNEGQRNTMATTQGVPKTLPDSQDEPNEEELLGLCTAKFTMSADSQTEHCTEESEAEKTGKENQTLASPTMVIYSSEDDDSGDLKTRTVRRKKRKRVIEFSDDEDAQEPLAFDDEENEIQATVFTGFKDNSKGGIRAEFLEKEAELSGSDVNSGDEAEESDDDMEEEEGDREHFDTNELRNQVGKAHLRSLLDSDKREVRLLQEMYLEDGELHGQGRSRQFRWKNVDKRFDDNETRTLSDEGEGSDDNLEESEWRKQKIEREKFMLEQKTKMNDEAELYEFETWSSSSKFPKEDSGSRKPLTPIAPPQETSISNPWNPLKRQRGSFLQRDKTTLARIAALTRDRGDVGGAKQGGKFVFQHLGDDELPEKVEEQEAVSERRHSSTPVVKKPRVERQFSLMCQRSWT